MYIMLRTLFLFFQSEHFYFYSLLQKILYKKVQYFGFQQVFVNFQLFCSFHGYKIYDDINLLQYLLVSQMLESRYTFMMRLIYCNHRFCSFKASYILKCKIWKIFNFVNTFMIRLIYCNSYQSVRCQRVDRLLFLVLLISILIIIFIMIIIQQKLDVSLKQNCSKIAIQVDPRECMQRLLQVDQRECIHYTRVFFQYHYIGAGKN
eukprot:TRINITY_DN1246_c0_g1_i3.p2 TRINITY_DN1246_c0_g1~~TRINITY_DN1246_c0_g1_i3.p2  ORF type:complete len:205 (-),score=-21.62 TRINITY_DN1246_c0_g1_i3:79-693(-)